MTPTQKFLNDWDFNNIVQVPWHFILTIFKAINTWQLHFHSLPQLILLVITTGIFLLIVRKLLIIKRNLEQNSVILEITPLSSSQKSAYATQQLFSVLHDTEYRNSLISKLLGRKLRYSFEIASQLNKGINYYVRVSEDEKENMKRTIMSFLPGVKIKEVDDYINYSAVDKNLYTKVIEFKLGRRFGYPLQKQDLLSEHDPIAYITGMMTQLQPDERISYQVIVSPTESNQVSKMMELIYTQGNLFGYLNRPQYPYGFGVVVFVFGILAKFINKAGHEFQWATTELYHGSSKDQSQYDAYAILQQQLRMAQMKPIRQLSPFEQATVQSVKEKIEQPLYETSIRVLVSMKSKQALGQRLKGMEGALKPFIVPQYQSFKQKANFPPLLKQKIRELVFTKRLLSLVNNTTESLLSVSEVSDLYHIPARQTQTENIVKVLSRELPAPVSLKNGRQLDVIFGNNTYGGTVTPIGLTEEERLTHMYIIGRTGSGKTRLMFSMAKQDIKNGHGLAFIDPHGSAAEDLLASIPLARRDDLIYLNPIDLKHPVGINIMELTPGLDEDDAELEEEVVSEGIISLFRKVFAKDDNANAHRIEHILRNTIYTAFTVEGCTIFTINKLLTNPTFRKQVTAKLKDEDLVDFWKYEFGKAGDFQVVKMTQGVTAKVGRFLRSPTAKRMLEQEKSTINFDEIINSGKILICNFSQGKLGEDTSRLMGTTIMTKLQQAALKREYIPEEKRKIFYLYVDEFQNFATQSFTKMVTENRKYRMPLIIAEQSSSQQKDHDITNTILANVTTVVTFRSGNYVDEDLMLNQFAPYLQKGDIMNLPRYHFFIKISAIESEEPFSGENIFEEVKKDFKKIETLIQTSQKNWTIVYTKQKPQAEKTVIEKQSKETEKKPETVLTGSGLPKIKRK